MSLTGYVMAAGGRTVPSERCSERPLNYFAAYGRSLPITALRPGASLVRCDLRLPVSCSTQESCLSDDIHCFDGWLENAIELAGELGVAACDDVNIALAAYRRWGEQMGERLTGEYSFAIWDAGAQRLFALRDKVGVRPVFYALVDGGIVVGNLPGALAAHPGVDAKVDAGYAAEFLCVEETSFRDTLYAGIKRLPGGHHLVWRSGGAVAVRRYWRPTATVLSGAPENLQSTFGSLLARSVAAATRGANTIASDLSGGVDSSSVTVQLSRLVRAGQLDTGRTSALSLVYPGLPCDETAYIDSVAARLSFASHRFEPRYASLADCEAATRLLGYPYFPFNATGAAPLLEAARDRRAILLSGEGGDELFEPIEHAWRSALVRPSEWPVLRNALKRRGYAGGRTRSLLGRLRYAVEPFAGQPFANLISRWRDRRRALEGWPVSESWAQSVALRRRVDRLLYPRNARTLAMGSALSGAWSPSFEWLFFGSCVSGVETRHPLSSASLIEFCNRLPLSQLDGQGTLNRLMLRRAGDGDLPPAVAERASKAEFTPATLPALLQRAAQQLDRHSTATDSTSAASASFGYHIRTEGVRHIWRLDAALAFDLWLQHLEVGQRAGIARAPR